MAEFRRVFRVQGMDTRINPRFQMVPVGDVRFVALHDGAGMTVAAAPSGTCTITEITESALPADDRATGATAAERGDRFFRLVGHAKGVATVTATGSTGIISLDISVKDLMTQRIHFYSVSDNAGHRSTRPLAEVGEILPLLNYLFRRQANIRMVRHGSLDPLEMAQNIVPIVVPDTPGLEKCQDPFSQAGRRAVESRPWETASRGVRNANKNPSAGSCNRSWPVAERGRRDGSTATCHPECSGSRRDGSRA